MAVVAARSILSGRGGGRALPSAGERRRCGCADEARKHNAWWRSQWSLLIELVHDDCLFLSLRDCVIGPIHDVALSFQCCDEPADRCCPQPLWDPGSTLSAGVMGYFDCPLTVECKHVASEWLHSADPLIQDFGARLMHVILSKDINLTERTPVAPPSELVPEQFLHYPWDKTPLKTERAKYKAEDLQIEVPMRHFYPVEDLETVGLRLGVFWVSPQWHYPEHVHQSLELHHRLSGHGKYLTGDGQDVLLAPGDSFLHLPDQLHGIESHREPLLTLWAERSVEVSQVPGAIAEIYELAADRVTATLKHAAQRWLQAEGEPLVQLFGQKLLPFIGPRAPELRKVVLDAPPPGMVPPEFRGCPWFPSGAYTQCMDPALKPLKDCIIYKGTRGKPPVYTPMAMFRETV
eukprot:Skav201138  [mRNA]  locus=scaffold4217:160613:169586:- [translate_table: standard]